MLRFPPFPRCCCCTDGKPISVFESGSINLYLCEKYKCFLPQDARLRTEVMSWVFWQVGRGGLSASSTGSPHPALAATLPTIMPPRP